MRLLAIILILSTGLAWASPLAELPDSHWAYGALRRLEGASLLDEPLLSGLTRYEAAMKVVQAEAELQRIPPDRSDALLHQLILSYLQEGNTFILTEGTSMEGRARILSMDLLNLREEFAEELAVLDPPASPVEDILTALSRLEEPTEPREVALDDLTQEVTGQVWSLEANLDLQEPPAPQANMIPASDPVDFDDLQQSRGAFELQEWDEQSPAIGAALSDYKLVDFSGMERLSAEMRIRF
ncbi:MAG: hypothetical protein ACOX20_04500 [Limnochordia bacterium]|jgi:hypothetical protein|nr:hypothetical protein [Bacillota bacterium]